ncbi:MAG: response regulator [Pirellulaceae bacterium]|nr:response regulator [Pirellulaceae bacterium]
MAFILIVDDDEDFAEAVATVCRAEGHEVAVAYDAAAANVRFAERLPDAVILDVMFPENPSGGFELARSIRKKWGEIPVLMLTAVNQQFPLGFSQKDIDPAWLPVHDFVEKPVDFEILKTKIADLLARSRRFNGE